MITVSCRSCGSDLEDPDDAVCMHCGVPVRSSRRSEPAQEPEPDATSEPDGLPLTPDDAWHLALWGALLVSIVAVGVITATLLAAFFRSGETDPAAAGILADTTTTTRGGSDGLRPHTPDFDPPVSGAITIANPTIDTVIRHHVGNEVVTFQIDGTFCGRGTGTLQATGVVHNYSMAQQTFDYVLHIELIRAWNRARIGELETTIEGLAPFESAEWSVEVVSSRVSTVECRVTEVAAIPAG